ncbi:olfactory receptor 6N1-like [Rhinatrema bivittatum]|uniref:olfactory receptor 6N1-like n=1 Tax=Rhinatrema bivittatum TaxID=194408 RepID=UPI00112A00C8|nr:olfactory receptor 6N1-like [Rhinatrema bivittatum]
MDLRNQTRVTEFVFVGFPASQNLQQALFVIFLLFYLLTVISNFVIITVVWTDFHLHTPMYFFIGDFSFLEIFYTTTTVPKMLAIFLVERKSIYFTSCMIQLYIFFSLGATECFLLVAMAYDRYLAICRPLHYPTLMNNRVCVQLIAGCWLSGFLASVLNITFIVILPFCGPNTINHFFCDYAPLLKLSCKDTSISESVFFTLSWTVALTSFFLIMASYTHIIFTILTIPSSSGRKKAFSTCASHLTVVCMFYSTVIFMYVRPQAQRTIDSDKIVSVFYTVVTPLLNPIIYSLRNKEVKESLKKALKRKNGVCMQCKAVETDSFNVMKKFRSLNSTRAGGTDLLELFKRRSNSQQKKTTNGPSSVLSHSMQTTFNSTMQVIPKPYDVY